ncbi:Coenzyme F420 hydrogenase/dehydrogenase, beta subunit C-terminal domain [Methanosarcina acetivorans]|uniref:Coenzyme F420 hydrogenase/dehydrogenase, beta subunit C-terminal domain n=1 Tax=Methanosarcina acetivorans TaxID=2214 RepID=UPI00373AE29D
MAALTKGKLVFFTKDGKEHAFPIDGIGAEELGRKDSCRYCQVKIPTSADLAWGTGKSPGFLRAGAPLWKL